MSEPIDDVRYYYYRDAGRRPMVTVCRILRGGVTAYGWAICSSRENPHKYDMLHTCGEQVPGGRTIARGRALRALKRGTRLTDTVRCASRRIQRQEAVAMLWRCGAGAVLYLSQHGDFSLLPQAMQPPSAGEMHAAS